MYFKTSEISLDEPTINDILLAVDSLGPKPNHFAVLLKSEFSYIQTSTDVSYFAGGKKKSSGFIMEYQDGSLDEHYQATELLNRGQVLRAFEWFLRNDERYISAFIWEKIPLGDEAKKNSSRNNETQSESVDDLTLKRALEYFGLEENATKVQLQKKYREMIAKCHPDRVNHLDKEFRELAEEKTKLLNQAYKLLAKKISAK